MSTGSRPDDALEGMRRSRTKHFMQRQPYRIQIETSSKCDAGCVYCGGLSSNSVGLSSDQILTLLKEAVELGVERIDWTGGDPLERPDWESLMRRARYLGMINSIWTPGVRLGTPCMARKIIDLTRGGIVCFHIDSLDPEILSRFRRESPREVLTRSLKGMQALLDAGKPKWEIVNRVKLTAAHNLADLRRTFNQLHDQFGVKTFIDHVRPNEAYPELVPDSKLVHEAFELQTSYYGREREKAAEDCRRHHYGTTFFVNAGGTVTSCHSLKRPVGSITKEPLADILDRGREALFAFDPESGGRPRDLEEQPEADLCWVCSAENVL